MPRPGSGPGWVQSHHCESGNCVELKPAGPQAGNSTEEAVLMRNSTDPGNVLAIPRSSWQNFASEAQELTDQLFAD